MSLRQPYALLLRQEGVYFCLRFALYTVANFLVLYALDDQFVVPFTRLIARLSHTILTTLGAQSWVQGASVGIPGFAVEIKNNCNAIYEIGLYAAAVVAYPAPWLKRTLGFVMGASLLYLANLLRVLALIGLGRYVPGGFQVAPCLPLPGPLPCPRRRLLALTWLSWLRHIA